METPGTSGIFADNLPGSAALGAQHRRASPLGSAPHPGSLLGKLSNAGLKSIIPDVSKEGQIVTEGTVTQVLPGTMFRVDLPGQRNVLAHISGKMRKHFIRIVPGDKVSVELSPYDLTKARIIFREQ